MYIFLPSEENSTVSTTNAKAGGTAGQSDEERKAEQARKIAEFLAKPEVKEMSAGLEEIAQAVVVAVEDKALTQRIYEKCMEKFDGETNTLWMHLEGDSKLKGNGGWNKRVDVELGKGRKNAVVKGLGNVDVAIKKFEKTVGAPLHLFWMYPSDWDKKTTPIVAFLPFDQDFKARKGIPAIDSRGNRYVLGNDGALAKKRPVLVLTINERTNLDGKPRFDALVDTDHETISKSPKSDITLLTRKRTEDAPKIQNISNVTHIRPGGISISSTYVDTENEPAYGGTMEFFYTAKHDADHRYGIGQTVYLGTQAAPNVYGPFPTFPFSGKTFIYYHYYEADFPLFDDHIVTHPVERPTFPVSFTQQWVVYNMVYAGYNYVGI